MIGRANLGLQSGERNMLASVYTAVLLAQSAVGGIGHAPPRLICCDVCGVEKAEIACEITRLQTCRFWKDRDKAARSLRHYDWECHPEIVLALVNAMLRDCHEEVREESAESLAKLAPCMAVAHQALAFAAKCDPDHATRHWARRALAKLDRRCVGACAVCAVVTWPAVVLPQAPLSEPFLAPLGTPAAPSPAPPDTVTPETGLRLDDAPRDLPGTVPGVSPFSASAVAPEPAKSLGRQAGILRRANLGSILLGRPDRDRNRNGDRERGPY
jgi:HEAT repeats